ncbi:MAG: hypothetical protein Q4P15_09135 [Propionibacteriaceae bacterium]|nr:hypothetical protein [Propionibacteriaceae bacterium]
MDCFVVEAAVPVVERVGETLEAAEVVILVAVRLGVELAVADVVIPDADRVGVAAAVADVPAMVAAWLGVESGSEAEGWGAHPLTPTASRIATAAATARWLTA